MKRICSTRKYAGVIAALVACAIVSACGGGTTEPLSTEPDSMTPGTVTPDTPPPMPTVVNGNVQWAFAPQPSAVSIEVKPFARLPLTTAGAVPRINVMTHVKGRILVADERDGRVYDITDGTATLWFDVAQAIANAVPGRQLDAASNFHSGFRSIAFHPGFEGNGKFYVSLMEKRPDNPDLAVYLSDVAAPIDSDSVLIEWTADPATMTPNPGSYRELFRVGMPVYDHTIKQIAFNPYATTPGTGDYGLLYIGHGDGSEKSATAGGGTRNDALGKILRIDPLAQGTKRYSIPASNPYVGNAAMLDEAYSIGHRNPHHLAFTNDGMLLTVEPGRDNIDEVNVVKPGANYGWSEREGTYMHLPAGGLLNGIAELPTDDAVNGYTYPVAQLGHSGPPGDGFVGLALGGGYVAEDSSALSGLYFYCEFATTGAVFYSHLTEIKDAVTQGEPGQLTQAITYQANILFDHDNNPATDAIRLDSMKEVLALDADYDGTGRADIRFGQGPDGTLYLMSKRNRMVYQISNSRRAGP